MNSGRAARAATDMSIQKPPDARDLRYLRLVSGREQGMEEDRIAQWAGEESPTALYERIREDGHSICPKCGTTYVDETHCKAQQTGASRDAPKARSSGPVRELPPASNATPLFREKLETLSRGNEELKYRKEKLQAGLFSVSSVQTVSRNYVRAECSEEQWRSLSEHYGFDPDADSFSRPEVMAWSLGEATPAPQAPLPALIAAYLLTGGEVEPLVKALHPNPESAEWEEIEQLIDGRKGNYDKRDGLKVRAEQLAKLVRGSTLGRRPPGKLSNHELNLSSRIKDHREAGMQDEEIFEKLHHNLRLEQGLSWDEYCRLRDLNREWPFR